MKAFVNLRNIFILMLAVFLAAGLCACASGEGDSDLQNPDEPDLSRFLVCIEDDPDTVDFQCTSIHYTVALNAFNRLVEMEESPDETIKIVPSLAKSVEVSDNSRVYTFHLQEGVTFSNGSPLTSSDVCYTLTRLLTHPHSANKDIAEPILGAEKLERGETDSLEGFQLIDDLNFSITLTEPFAPFLACLAMPGGSILDKETTEKAGDLFGTDPENTVGTGPFVLWKWEPHKGMLLKANETCWQGRPALDGLDLRFLTESEDVSTLFEEGILDILDLDELGNSAEYYYHGDIYQDRLYQVQQIGITYIALNESIAPLNDVRVRKALQLGLNRQTLLGAVYSNRGVLENGIFPHGLYGCNPNLPEIPYDPEEAKELLAEAGYPEGFDLTVSVKASSTQWEMTLLNLSVSMWEQIGIRAKIEILDESEFMQLRKSGSLACYTATWIADYDDPDNFIFTFFGNRENTINRSLCYPREEIMERVRKARTISDPDARIQEYHDLEQTIIQDDAAWIPLFSRLRYYVISDRVEGFCAAWNGSVKNKYPTFSLKDE
ncbi:MAG: ABC transporter substrate-binding protein [Parasporobacterium sp.]|nr:ABC transporter substrate-binding protein [Parasporobacterium sp.]